MTTSELIEKLRAYADLFERENRCNDFNEDLEALEYLLLKAAYRLEKAYGDIIKDCYSCKHYDIDEHCDYNTECVLSGDDGLWKWRGDDE